MLKRPSIPILFTLLAVISASVGSQDATIVASGAKLEQVFSGGFFLEGPAVAPDGAVYFSDITYSQPSGMQAGHIWRHDPKTGTTAIFRSPSGMANGIAFDRNGDMVVAEGADFGGRRVSRTDMKTGKAYILAGTYNGRPFNSPNDLVIDTQGRIYFTDPRYLGHEPMEQPVMGIYRIEAGGSVTLLAGNLWKPNGIGLAPDQRTLYVVEVGDYNANIVAPPPLGGGPPSAVHSFDILQDGTLRYRTKLVVFQGGMWGDGMTVDADGNLYIGVGGPSGSSGVYVYAPDGRQLAVISTPETAVNVVFGRGADANLLYIVCSRSVTGAGLWKPPVTNGLYRIRLQRRGV